MPIFLIRNFRKNKCCKIDQLIDERSLIRNILCLFADFISVELDRGQPRLLIDFGSGTLELKVKTKKSLDDGEWHKIDVFWDTEVRI